ncbi:MAG TPA: hypothetical protein VFX29_01840 [Longimicrobiaceae bacterium]|nr:hypothetical protein [Longimicrobiaceae bacterium]
MELSENERHVLIHTLTGSHPNGKVYRNYYAAGPGHHSEQHLGRLCDLGLMRRGRTFNDGQDQYYHCTQAGAAAVGLALPAD